VNKVSYKIKSLAQRLPKQGTIAPGIYELEDLGQEVIDYQKKLKNLIEIHTEVEQIADSTFDLKLKVEDTNQTQTPIKRNRKTRRNINDDSN
jgi:hypothetical protein